VNAAKLDNANELLHRNIHPSWMDDGKPSSLAFSPSAKDEGKLSVDREDVDTAEASFLRHTVEKKLKSVAIFSVSVGEFGSQNIDCFEDPITKDENNVENLAHCYADYTGMSKKQIKLTGRVPHPPGQALCAENLGQFSTRAFFGLSPRHRRDGPCEPPHGGRVPHPPGQALGSVI